VAYAVPTADRSKFTLFNSKDEKLGVVSSMYWESVKVEALPMTPALPGFYVVSLLHDYEDSDTEMKNPTYSVWQEPILGWKGTYAVVLGSIGFGYDDTYADGQSILYPSGEVFTFDRTFITKEKWLEFVVAREKESEARAKA
jgi:hypothetical protein